jgi:membrane protease YdiL (CAAX protease family)
MMDEHPEQMRAELGPGEGPLGLGGEGLEPSGEGPKAPEGGQLVRLALWFYGGLGAVALLWRRGLQGQSLWLASPGAEIGWLRDPLLGLLAGAFVVLVSGSLARRTRAGELLARRLAEAIGPLAPRQCWTLALASGLAEEAFFRGALQPVVGIGPASALFAAAHLVPRRDWLPWCAFSLAAGLLLGALVLLTGNLVAAVVAHVLINGINLNRLVRERALALRPPGRAPPG